MIISPHAGETYLQICVDCAAPPKVLYCDGTWKQEPGAWCEKHRKAMVVACNHIPLASDCQSCKFMKGQEIAALTLEVIQPWARGKLTEAGVQVFEYGSAGSEKTFEYAHKEQCQCNGVKISHPKRPSS